MSPSQIDLCQLKLLIHQSHPSSKKYCDKEFFFWEGGGFILYFHRKKTLGSLSMYAYNTIQEKLDFRSFELYLATF